MTMNEKLATATLIGDFDVRIERHFDAPRDAVFAAWTDPESIVQWWDPSGVPLADASVDLRPGGKFVFVHQGGEHEFAGTYRTIDPPARLIFATPAPGGGETVGTLEFDAESGGTRLVMTLSSPSAEARRQLLKFRVDQGTVRTLENLAAFLARSGQDDR